MRGARRASTGNGITTAHVPEVQWFCVLSCEKVSLVEETPLGPARSKASRHEWLARAEMCAGALYSSRYEFSRATSLAAGIS